MVVTVLSAPAGASFTDGDVDRDGVGRLVEIDAAVGGAAVVLHLEGEVGIGVPLALAAGTKVSWPALMSAARRELPAATGDAVELERPVGRRAS